MRSEEQQNRELSLTIKQLENIKLRSKEEGIIIGREHTRSSPETSSMLEKMEEKQDRMDCKLDGIKEEFADLRVAIASLPGKLLEESDKRYASKEFEGTVKRAIAWIATIVGGVLVLVFMKVFFK